MSDRAPYWQPPGWSVRDLSPRQKSAHLLAFVVVVTLLIWVFV